MRFLTRKLSIAALLAVMAGGGVALAQDVSPSSPQTQVIPTADPVLSKPVSFTSRLTEGSCGAGCKSDGYVQTEQSSGCWVSSLIDDEPLLSSLRDVPLTDCWTVSVGGELRHRHMNESNRLRPGGPGDSSYDLWRFTPWVELKGGDDFTGYVQAIDASIFNQELNITGIDQNRADLLQFYLDFTIAEAPGGKVKARVGRQFLKYGSQHLVSPLGWANTFRNFEGVKLYYKGENWDIDGFWTRPVNGASGNVFRPMSADHPDASRTFSGIYSTYKGFENGTLDLYWLFLDEDNDRGNRIDGRRHTFGGRYAGKTVMTDECGNARGTLTYEFEGAFQVGDQESFLGAANEDIEAGMFHTAIGYTFDQIAWSPTIKGLFYWSSGDDNPGDGENQNFNTLFPLGHAYWGIIDNLNGSNLLDYSIQGSVKPTKKLTVVSQLHWFEKDEAASPIFNVAGAPFPGGATTTGDTDIGTELDLIATYQFTKTLQVQAGYSWFWYGDAVSNETGIARGDADQFYIMTTWSF